MARMCLGRDGRNETRRICAYQITGHSITRFLERHQGPLATFSWNTVSSCCMGLEYVLRAAPAGLSWSSLSNMTVMAYFDCCHINGHLTAALVRWSWFLGQEGGRDKAILPTFVACSRCCDRARSKANCMASQVSGVEPSAFDRR